MTGPGALGRGGAAARVGERHRAQTATTRAAASRLASAQVHATLATAAAFLAVAVIRPDDRDAWDHAMGTGDTRR